MSDPVHLLLPRPREAAVRDGGFTLPDQLALSAAGAVPAAATRRLLGELAELGVRPRTPSAGAAAADVRLELVAGAGDAGGYRLVVGPEGIRLRAADPAGIYYGVSTLIQWLRIHLWQTDGRRTVPAIEITDRPDFRVRGVMLDVSRDKVPRLDTLRRLIDLLAGWKVNQLQLYMEHTFAYPGHEVVWRGASPYTAADVRALDAYCRERFIELVPNQNSFGHFHRWLVHEPYRRLAECPEGIEHPFSFEREPYGLCATDPRSLELLAGLYDQLLPCFTSQTANVGLDETFDLGQGRSAAACAERGKGRVYLDFLTAVHRMLAERGRRMQFWGDVILAYPELLAELPGDAVALEWGYEADHPFAADARRFAESGLEFYVCPGTSSWNSFAGRTDNALANLAAAAVYGHAEGAAGYLITDWGDRGHLQPLPVSYPGLAAGATFAWNVAAARSPGELPLAELLDLHVFGDRAGLAGGVVTGLGNAYLEAGVRPKNASVLFLALILAHREAAKRPDRRLTAAGLERVEEHVERTVAPLAGVRCERDDSGQVRRELAWVAEALRCACRLAAARLEAGVERPLAALPAAGRADLARRIGELTERHRELWLVRNRPGGLDRSSAWLERVRDQLEPAA